ncbi:MAG TPA: AMP-binding protein [Candidatus Acidoferrales bacterium]|nr:AMP-binding protein [Candidatus Acidoferrales bacterium]
MDRLNRASNGGVLQEVREGHLVSAELLTATRAAQAFLAQAGLRRGERCALLAHNSIRWAALDLALMARGIIVVPLYARQSPAELVAMMKDCSASLVFCGDAALRDAVEQAWPGAPRLVLFDEVFATAPPANVLAEHAATLADSDAVTIIYTSGTSGEPKGVVLTVGNVNHMLSCTTARLDLLMGPRNNPEQVFHYLPFCFAGSWILLLSCLSREAVLTLSTDLTKLADEIRLAQPHYFLNVPTLLERIRAGAETQLSKRGGMALKLFERAIAAWLRQQAGSARWGDPFWLGLSDRLLFSAIRRPLGRNLKTLICGSAPLAKETQLFFMMLGIPVLQVYGLTETTAICTMDHPERIEAGRVGLAIPGIEMRLGEKSEILVRGPNISPGYWNRPEETAKVLQNGWFHTGDQGEVSDAGNWSIVGRLKNLIVLDSGHNVAPEPLEETLLRRLPSAKQVVVMGNGRSFLSAVVTGGVAPEEVEAALESVNGQLPHYKRIRAFHVETQPFTIESGLLTANGKLKRDAIAARFGAQMGALRRRSVSAGEAP